MDIASTPTVPQAEPELHRFTVEEYMRLGESFPRSELLDGLIYDKQRADQPEPELHRFTVEEYMRLGDEFPRSELLDGLIYDVPPVNEPHAYAVEAVNKTLVLGLAAEPCRVRPGHPLAVQGWHGPWAPQPDLAVVYDEPYRNTPTAENSLAFIEVSDSTYNWDRKHKIPIYVASGVPTWQVNLNARQVEYYASPKDLEAPVVFVEGDTFEVLGVRITVASLLLPVEASPDA